MAKSLDISKKRYSEGINQTKYEKGIDAVSINPASEAVAHKDEFEKNTLAGKPRMVQMLSKVPLSEWQNATKNSYSKLEEKTIRAINIGKWDAATVKKAGIAAHESVQNMPKGGPGNYSKSYDRYLAAQKAEKQAWGYSG